MIEINHRQSWAVLHTVEADTLSGANLSEADLRGAITVRDLVSSAAKTDEDAS